MSNVTTIQTQSHSSATNLNAEVLREIRRVLESSGYSQFRNVEIEIHQRLVLIRGDVHSYFQKQVAQELVKSLSKHFSLRNEIRVAPKTK